MRRVVTTTMVLAVFGFLLFLAGFALGASKDLPSPIALAGGVLVAVVALAGIIAIQRIRGPR